MSEGQHGERVTLGEIKELAEVGRPTVSNWRRRHASFPEAVGGSESKPLFDAEEIAGWLDERPVPDGERHPDGTLPTYGERFRRGLRLRRLIALKHVGESAERLVTEALAVLAMGGEGKDTIEEYLPPQLRSDIAAADPRVVDAAWELAAELGSPGAAADAVLELAARLESDLAMDTTPPVVAGLISSLVGSVAAGPGQPSVINLCAGTGELLFALDRIGGRGDIVAVEPDPLRRKLLTYRLWAHWNSSVDDGATVPVFYEPHLVKVDLIKDADLDDLDARAEGLIEGLSEDEKRSARQQFGRYETLIGSPARIGELAGHLLEHWDARSKQMEELTGWRGKGMVVCASRAIAARLFEEVIRRRPDWKGERDPKSQLLTDTTGRVRVVFTGNAATDSDEVADYVRTPAQLKKIQERVTDPGDELELVIVQSLWLTGFDAPPLHTLYLDKRMRGAALMQAIARVNRTWPGKPSGLVVDFQGVIREIKKALAEYSEQDQADPMLGADLAGAVQLVRESHQHIEDILHGCGWRTILAAGGPRSYREALVEVLEFLITPEPGPEPEQATRKQRFMYHSGLLRQAFSLCPTDPRVQDLLPDIRFFETVRKSREKYTADERQEQDTATAADTELLIAQLHASVIAADGVVDIYDAAGLTRPDLSHLDESLLRRLQASRHPNLAIEALRRALLKEIRDTHPRNLTRQESFTSRVRAAMNRYTNGLLTAAEFMKFLIELAREVSADRGRAETLGLTEDELAFYDALAADPSAVEKMDDSILARIAHELYEQIRKDVTVDWKLKEQARDRIMARVLRLLRKYGYPPDKQPAAIERVLKQAEDLAEAMA